MGRLIPQGFSPASGSGLKRQFRFYLSGEGEKDKEAKRKKIEKRRGVGTTETEHKRKKEIEGNAPIGAKSHGRIRIKEGGHMSPKSALNGNVTVFFWSAALS